MKTRRLLSILLTMLMVFSCFNTFAYAAEVVDTVEETQEVVEEPETEEAKEEDAEVEVLATELTPINFSINHANANDQHAKASTGKDVLGRTITIIEADASTKPSSSVSPASFTQATADYNVIKVVYKSPSDTTPTMSVFANKESGEMNTSAKTISASFDEGKSHEADKWVTAYYSYTSTEALKTYYQYGVHGVMFNVYASEASQNHTSDTFEIGYAGYFGDLEDAKAHVSDFEGELNITGITVGGTAISGFSASTTEYTYDLGEADTVPAVALTGSGDASGITVECTNVDTTTGTAIATIEQDGEVLYTVNFTGGAMLTDIAPLPIKYTYSDISNNCAVYYNGVDENDIFGRTVHRITPNFSSDATKTVGPGGNLSAEQTQYKALKAVYKTTDTQAFVFRPMNKNFGGAAVYAKETKTVGDWTVAYYDMTDLFKTGGVLEAGLLYYMGTVFSGNIGTLTEDTRIDFGYLALFGNYADAKAHVSDFEGDLSITGIKVDGTAISGFDVATTQYEYDLAGASVVPTVTLAGKGNTDGLSVEYTEFSFEDGTAEATIEKDGEVLYTVNFTGGATTTEVEPIELSIGYKGIENHRCLTENKVDDFSREYVLVNPGNQYFDNAENSDMWATGEVCPGGSIVEDYKTTDYKVMKLVIRPKAKAAPQLPSLRWYAVSGESAFVTALDSPTLVNNQWNVIYYDYSAKGAMGAWQVYLTSDDVANHLEDTFEIGYVGLFGSLGDAKLHVSDFEGDFTVTDVLLDGVSIGDVTEYDYDLAGASTIPVLTAVAKGNTDNVVITNGKLDGDGNAVSTIKDNGEAVVTVNFTGGTTVFGVTAVYYDGIEIEDFDADTTEYNIALNYGAAQPVVTFGNSGTAPETVEVTYETVEGTGYKAYIMDGETVLYTINFNVDQNKPEALINTLYKLQADKEIVIGYFGGSVTAGTGATSANNTSWRGITRDWFKSTFPSATVVERNAGWGGTGAIFGIFRADRDLIKDDCPDIVFIEMCVNDSYDGIYGKDEQYVYIESIIQKLYKVNPKINIVLLVVGDNGIMKQDIPSTGGVPSYGVPYTKLSEHYNLPILYIGHELAKTIYAENGNKWPNTTDAAWKKYFERSGGTIDGVHPNDTGYAHYAASIIDYLEEQLPTSYTPTATEYAAKVLPETLYCTENNKGELLSDAYMLAPEAVGNSAGFGNYAVVDNNGKYFRSSKEGDVISFKFNSKNLGLWTWSYGTQNSKNGTNIAYSVDGGPIQTANIYRSYPNNKIYYLAKGLSEGEHTIRIIHTDNNTPFDIRFFLLWGQSEGLDKTISAVSPITLVDTASGEPIVDEITGEPIINATIEIEGATDEENAALEQVFDFDPTVYRYEIPVAIKDGKAEIDISGVELLSTNVEYPTINVTVPEGYYGYTLTQAGEGGTGTNVAILSVDNVADYEFEFVLADAPENFTVTKATTAFGKDAKITFAEATSKALEIKKHDADDWTSYDAGITEITGLSAGLYLMRYTDGENTGSEVEVRIWETYPEDANVLYISSSGTGNGLTPENPFGITNTIKEATDKLATAFPDTYKTNENYIVMVGDVSHTVYTGPSLAGYGDVTITAEDGARFYMHTHINHSKISDAAKLTWKNVDVVLGVKTIRLGDRAKYEAGELTGVPNNNGEIYYSSYGQEVVFDNFNIVEYYPAAVYVQYCTYKEDGTTVASWTSGTELYTGATVRRSAGLYIHYFSDGGGTYTLNECKPLVINSPGLNIAHTRASGYNTCAVTGDVNIILDNATVHTFGTGGHGGNASHTGTARGVINGGRVTSVAYVGAQSSGKINGSALLIVNGGAIAKITAKNSTYNTLDTALIINNGLTYTVETANIDYYLKSAAGGSADAVFADDNTIASFVFTTDKELVVIDGVEYETVDGTVTVAAATVGTGESSVTYKNKDVAVNFNVGTAGSEIDSITIEKGNDIVIADLPTPTVTDGINEFKGWSLTEGGEIYTGEKYTVTGETTLYAVYDLIEHEITYAYGENKYATVPESATCGNNGAITVAEAPTFNNGAKYEFLGWSDGETTYQPGDEIAGVTADVTLTAQWNVDANVWYISDWTGTPDGGYDPSEPFGTKLEILTPVTITSVQTAKDNIKNTLAETLTKDADAVVKTGIDGYAWKNAKCAIVSASAKIKDGSDYTLIVTDAVTMYHPTNTGHLTIKGLDENSTIYVVTGFKAYRKGDTTIDNIKMLTIGANNMEPILPTTDYDYTIGDNVIGGTGKLNIDGVEYLCNSSRNYETEAEAYYNESTGTLLECLVPYNDCINKSISTIRLFHSNYYKDAQPSTNTITIGNNFTAGVVGPGANYNQNNPVNVAEAISGSRTVILKGNTSDFRITHAGRFDGVATLIVDGGNVTNYMALGGVIANNASTKDYGRNSIFGYAHGIINGGTVKKVYLQSQLSSGATQQPDADGYYTKQTITGTLGANAQLGVAVLEVNGGTITEGIQARGTNATATQVVIFNNGTSATVAANAADIVAYSSADGKVEAIVDTSATWVYNNVTYPLGEDFTFDGFKVTTTYSTVVLKDKTTDTEIKRYTVIDGVATIPASDLTAEGNVYEIAYTANEDEVKVSGKVYVDRTTESAVKNPAYLTFRTADGTLVKSIAIESENTATKSETVTVDGVEVTLYYIEVGNVIDVSDITAEGAITVSVEKNGYLAKKIKTYDSASEIGGTIVDNLELDLVAGDIKGNYGDICGDGIVDIDDFIRIIRGFSKELSEIEEFVKAVDIDEDGEVTVMDLSFVKSNFGRKAE